MSKEMTLIDEIYDRMNDDNEIINHFVDLGESEVQKFYAGKTLFITGVTGFMGKCLMEKLLRSCPDVKRIYILMRQKKNQSVEERMKKFLDNEIFQALRKSNINIEEKVKIVGGNLTLDKLGLSNEDEDRIKKETNIIIHIAANVRFNARVHDLLKSNVLGTKYMLDLAEQCENLEVFMYVSSVFSHDYKLKIEEKFYKPPADMSMIYAMIDADSKTEKGLSDDKIKMFIGDCLNCYTFTKAISEELVRERAEKVNFFCGIFRPSIVVSTYKEPLHGWTDNRNGPVYLFLAAGLGLIHTGLYYDRPFDLVPCDMSINALIVVTQDLPKQYSNTKEAVIYNYGTSVTNPTKIWEMYSYLKDCEPRYRSSKAVWLNCAYLTPNHTLFWILHILLHFIPACFADLVLLLMFRKPQALPIFFQFTWNIKFLLKLVNTDWKIYMPKTLKVIEDLNLADEKLFFCDPRKILWEEWTTTMFQGLRRYILKENLQSKASERRYVLLWWAHYGTITVVCSIATYFYFQMVSSLFC